MQCVHPELLATLQRDLAAMAERNTELAKRVSELENELLDMCTRWEWREDPKCDVIARIRKLAVGP